MLSRTLKSAAVCTAVLAVAALAAPAGARAADECLTAPKGATPAGAHWYYRLEKGTKRKCWYLADEVSKAARTTSSAAAPAAASETPPPPAAKSGATRNRAARPSVADARAELTTPENDQPALTESVWPPLESTDAVRAPEPAAPPTADRAATAAPQGWTMAARWPESNAAAPDRAIAAAEPSTAAPAPAVTPQQETTDPLRIALIVLTAALLAAGLAGRLLLRRARATRPAPPRPIWPDERPDHPHGLRTSAEVEEIESLLRASRSATG